MEDEHVFAETHRLVFRLIDEGKVTGLRIDHPDGLYQPSAYFRRLQARAQPLYVVVEKILEGKEKMPGSWTVDGTTGYEFLAAASGLFVDWRNAGAFDALYARFIGEAIDWKRLVYQKKQTLMRSSMASEMNVLSHRLNRLSEGNRRTRDFTLNALKKALIEFVARLPIYRTYVEGEDASAIEGRDRRYIESTLAAAKRASRELNKSIYDFLGEILLLKKPTPDSIEFVRKLQQVTGPITAKAIEDTAFYAYNRLLSLNEVGGDPRQFGTTVEEFHALNRERLLDWPGSLNSTSTHDTKRSEDVRTRIAALSEIPIEWEKTLGRWAQLNGAFKTTVVDAPAPDANEELLVYQTLIGAFPDDERVTPELVARVQAYLEKALKEAKVHSSWTNPDDEYEQAVKSFAGRALASAPFLADFVPFVRRIAQAARLSSLSQVAFKVASPGVPDVYQGCELWDLSLVDPDNRRPVDFTLRARLLEGIRGALEKGPAARAQLARELASTEGLVDGRAKLLLLREALRWRRADPLLFSAGDYQPLIADGAHAAHVVAFARALDGRAAICVAPRLTLTLLDAASPTIGWQGQLRLPESLAGAFEDVVTGARVTPTNGALSLAQCFASFPVALLRSVK